MTEPPITVRTLTLSGQLPYCGVTLLSYTIAYPELVPARGCLPALNRHWRQEALSYARYCRGRLFRQAAAQYRDDLRHGYPVRVFEAVQVLEVTYLHACILSLYFDRYEYTGGAHGTTARQSETWQLDRCRPVPLQKLVCHPPGPEAYLLPAVAAAIRRESELYFDDAPELARETFRPERFYCRPEGLVLYYGQYDIAPYAAGIREFLFPYTDCVKNPETLC
ncbi:MAG: DUF3298 and DUF4163 domain-containing protein [Eubacteriales bacterium]